MIRDHCVLVSKEKEVEWLWVRENFQVCPCCASSIKVPWRASLTDQTLVSSMD
jgi:hypothetical protein